MPVLLLLLPPLQIGGLLVQGAAFDGQRLSPVTQVRSTRPLLLLLLLDGLVALPYAQDAPTSRVIPPMYLAWLPKDSTLPYQHYINTPLYATQVLAGSFN